MALPLRQPMSIERINLRDRLQNRPKRHELIRGIQILKIKIKFKKMICFLIFSPDLGVRS